MSYQVIARKYRPQTFRDVVGQEHVTTTLTRAIEQNRIAHAYLFCGPRGTGKTTIARIFAKCLNCTDGPKVDFDENDSRCREIAEGRSLDVLEVDAASNRGIDEIRGLRETVRYAPATSKFKIYIIDEVHMLTKEAFNALLKTLEEPPAHAKFMFATTEPEKVLPTILSRCQRFDLRRIPTALIVKHLEQIAVKENVKVDTAALHAIARGAEGGMRDAESTLDQLISFCGAKIEESDVLSMFGLTSQSKLIDLAGAILGGDVTLALKQLNELAASGKDLARLISDLLNHFRNLLIFKITNGDSSMLEASEAELTALKAQQTQSTPDGLTRILEVLGDAELRLREAASKKILLEVAVLRCIEARNAVSVDSVLKQLNALREASGSQAPAAPSSPLPSPHDSAPVRSGSVAGAAQSDSKPPPAPAGELREFAPLQAGVPNTGELWTILLEAVGRASPFTRTYLLEAHLVSFEKNLLIIGFPPEFEEHIGLVDNSRNHALLQTKMAELGFPGIQVKFSRSDRPASTPAPTQPKSPESTAPEPTATPRVTVATARSAPLAPLPQKKEKLAPTSYSEEDFKNDPLIQKALDAFKGRIVEVRA
jgi:DNA polymerase-3 subunit gamma/tau